MRNNLIIALLFFAACSNAPVETGNVTDTLKKVTTDTTVVIKKVSEIDKQLAEFEKLINSYIAVSKKAKKGDVSALSECTSISVEAKNIENQLLDQANKLTADQQNKLRELAVNLEKASDLK